MRAILRGMAVLGMGGGLWLAPASALAQDAPQAATTNTTAPATVGPSELQNFSLSGNVTKPSDQQTPAPATRSAQSPATTRSASTSLHARQMAQSRPAVRQPNAPGPSAPAAARASAAPTPAVLAPPSKAAPVQRQQPAPGSAIETRSAAPDGTFAPEHRISILPWLIAVAVLAGGMIFLLWRRRPRKALAGPEFDEFTTRQPAPHFERAAVPTPVPGPAPTRAPAEKREAAAPSGIVASRLRPSIELGVQPLRCVIEDSQVTIEFEVELFNAGTAPARAVLAEASLLNAGATQDQELAAFFASPVGVGERLDAIPPMRRISLTSRVVAPRGAIQEYEFAGRKAFVPVIAFNALYEWSGGKAQTSAAYLVGRDTRSEKLGPLHLDQGERAVTTLAAHELPAMVRT